jgi:asparagine synthase (glutamine-hydrolysing)
MAALDLNRQALPCYTFGGTWGETFDIRTARRVANACKQSHAVIRIDDRFLKNFGDFARRSIFISDGTHDAFGAHDVYFNQLARELAPMRLTGKFGSEVVRVRKLIPSVDVDQRLFQDGLREVLRNVPPPDQITSMHHGVSRVVAEEIPWYEYGRVAVEQSQVVLRTPYMDNEIVRLMYQAPDGTRKAGSLQAQYVKDKSASLHVILTNLSRSGEHSRFVKELLFLWFWALFKAEYIYLFATPHWATWIDRRLEKLHLERFFSGRQKFEGYRIWIRTHFSEFIHDTLLSDSANINRLFDKVRVRKMVTGHIAGTHNYLDEINKLLTVELIYSSLLKP